MSPRGAPLWIALAGAWLACAGAARAQPSIDQQDKVAAQALFDEAMSLRSAGRHADACPKLLESLRLDPAIGTRFYLADCFERTGRVASAWTNFVRVADEAKTLGQPDRERAARLRAERLRPRLPQLTIDVPDEVRRIPGLSVQHGAQDVGVAQWGVGVPVDPGEQVVSATAPGRARWEARITTREGAAVAIEVPMLAPAEAEPPAIGAKRDSVLDRPGIPAPSAAAPARARMHPRRLAGFITGGVGAAAVGVGTAFGIRAALLQGQASCDDLGGCTTQASADRLNDAIFSADFATTTFIVGSALFAGGAVLVLTAPGAPPAGSERGFVPKVWLGPAGAGVGGAW